MTKQPISVKYPWFPGVLLSGVGLVLVIAWYYGAGKNSAAILMRALYNIIHIIGAIGVIMGIYIIANYIKNPKKARKKAMDYYKKSE
jgi:hypothetical protein